MKTLSHSTLRTYLGWVCCEFFPLSISTPGVLTSPLLTSSRRIFVSYCYQFGVCRSLSKQWSIILGDKTGTLVHSFYIYFAHLFGCLIYWHKFPVQSFKDLETHFFSMASESLASVEASEDAFTYAQVHWLIAHSYLTQSQYLLAEKYLESSVRKVKENLASFIPHSVLTEGPYAEMSEESRDRMAFLASLIYYRTLLCIRICHAKSSALLEEPENWITVRFPFQFLSIVQTDIVTRRHMMLSDSFAY